MKLTDFYVGLLLSLLITCITACSDDDKLKPITLQYEDSQLVFNNETPGFTLTPFNSETRNLVIKGGDGHYKVNNDNEDVVRVIYDGEKIRFQSLSLGRASVTIEDTSGHSYLLSIVVKYRELMHNVIQWKGIVQGNNITVGDKAKLEKELGASNQITKYVFTFKNEENTKGTILLYDKDGKSKEYEFETEFIKLETPIIIMENIKLDRYNRVTIKKEEGNEFLYVIIGYFLINERRDTTRNSPKPFYYFIKDLTEQYKAEYPAMEHAYSIQLVSYN